MFIPLILNMTVITRWFSKTEIVNLILNSHEPEFKLSSDILVIQDIHRSLLIYMKKTET